MMRSAAIVCLLMLVGVLCSPEFSHAKDSQEKGVRKGAQSKRVKSIPKVKPYQCSNGQDLRSLRKSLDEYEERLRETNKGLSAIQRKALWAKSSPLSQGYVYFATDIFWDDVLVSRKIGRRCRPLYLDFKDSLLVNDKKLSPIKLQSLLNCFKPLYGVHPSEAQRLEKCVMGAVRVIEKKQQEKR